MTRPGVVHLIDDLTAGGVTRVVDHLLQAPDMTRLADHRMVRIAPGALRLLPLQADIIVSHLTVSWRMIPTFLALRACNPNARFIHVEHSYTQRFVALNVPRKARFQTLLRLGYGIFDQVVAVSVAQRDWLLRAKLVRPAKLRAIPSCVDLSAFRALPAPTTGPRKIFGAIGRLEPQKGFDVLIQAFLQVPDPDLELRIYGTGAQEARLKQLAAEDPRVRFMGFAKDPVDAMGQVDVVAMPSQWEAYGLVAIEALAARRVLLINNVDGLRDHLAQGAVLADGPSAEDWALTIERAARAPSPTVDSRAVPPAPYEQISIAHWKALLRQEPVRGAAAGPQPTGPCPSTP